MPASDDAIVVRLAQLDEFALAGDLRAAMACEMGEAWDDEHPGWRERFAEYFRTKQQRGDAALFLAQRGSRIAGMAIFSLLDEYRAFAFGAPRGFVNSVFVDASLRRRGIARRLMEAGIDWLRRRGCVTVRLRTSDAGRELYASLGFQPGREMALDLRAASER